MKICLRKDWLYHLPAYRLQSVAVDRSF